MEFFTDFFLPVVYAFFSAMAFAFLYKVRGIEMFFTSLGGGIGWLFYLLVMFAFRFETDVAGYLAAAFSIALYAECMAILRRKPALIYSTIAIFPIVPGGAILRTMEYLLQGDLEKFASQGAYSLQVSGAIAIGILLGSSVVRLWRRAAALLTRQKGTDL